MCEILLTDSFRKRSIKGVLSKIKGKMMMVKSICDNLNVDNRDEIENIFKLYEINMDIEQHDVQFASEMIQDICEEFKDVKNVELVFKRFLFILLNPKKT